MDSKAIDILNSTADRISELILQKFGRERVEAIFLSGSVAESRPAYYVDHGFVEIYSDIDLYVIVSPGVDLGWARKEAGNVAKSIDLLTEHFRFFHPPDIGVYTGKDLLAQPHRPATVGMQECSRVLYGRAGFVSDSSRFAARAIPKEEALYLLENRLLEQASLTQEVMENNSDGRKRYLFYISLKNCLDVLSAILIFEGRYDCSLSRRMELFRQEQGEMFRLFSSNHLSLMEYAYNKISSLQKAMREDENNFLQVRRASEKLLLTAWRILSSSLFKKAPILGFSKLIGLRCRGNPLHNLREARVIAKRLGLSSLKGLSLWRKGPRIRTITALRLSGLCSILASNEAEEKDGIPGELLRYLEFSTRALGFGEGDLLARSGKLYRDIS